jgi:DNA-binding beta-propeller fold protein YncE
MPNCVGVAIRRDNTGAYYCGQGSASVYPVTYPSTVGATIAIATSGTDDIIITPDMTQVFVTDHASSLLWPITTASNTVGLSITANPNPNGLAMTADGKTLYACCGGAPGTVVPVDVVSHVVGTPITVLGTPGQIALFPTSSLYPVTEQVVMVI